MRSGFLFLGIYLYVDEHGEWVWRRKKEEVEKKQKKRKEKGSWWNSTEEGKKEKKKKKKKVVWHCYLTVTSQENGSHKFDFVFAILPL